jgi:hypothetical protein
VTVRGGGSGAAAGATMAVAVGSVVVMSPSPRLSQVVMISQWRWWHDIPRGGAAHWRGGAAR